jgi:CHRD domain-containing protein
MQRRCVIAATLLAALAAVSPAGAGPGRGDQRTMCVHNTRLVAANETTGSTSTAKGHAQIKIRKDGTIAWRVLVHNRAGETFTAGHIHLGPVGVAGDVVLPLHMGGATTARRIRDRGESSTPTSITLGAAICANPSAYYVNYHTTAFPGGAIRGQLG